MIISRMIKNCRNAYNVWPWMVSFSALFWLRNETNVNPIWFVSYFRAMDIGENEQSLKYYGRRKHVNNDITFDDLQSVRWVKCFCFRLDCLQFKNSDPREDVATGNIKSFREIGRRTKRNHSYSPVFPFSSKQIIFVFNFKRSHITALESSRRRMVYDCMKYWCMCWSCQNQFYHILLSSTLTVSSKKNRLFCSS